MSEKTKKSKWRIAIIGFIAIPLIWILLVVTDFIRFTTSDGYIQPIFTVMQTACGCGESRSEYGIGYCFDYGYIIDIDDSSRHYDKDKPDYRSFSVFDLTIYDK